MIINTWGYRKFIGYFKYQVIDCFYGQAFKPIKGHACGKKVLICKSINRGFSQSEIILWKLTFFLFRISN